MLLNPENTSLFTTKVIRKEQNIVHKQYTFSQSSHSYFHGARQKGQVTVPSPSRHTLRHGAKQPLCMFVPHWARHQTASSGQCISSLQMGHSSVRGLRRLEWGQGSGWIGRSGVSCCQVLAGCVRGPRGVDAGVCDDEAMAVDTLARENVWLFSFRVRTGASTGDCGGVTKAAGVAAELEADDDVISLLFELGERIGVLLAGDVSLTSTTTELEVDKADTLDDALDRSGESVGVRNSTAGVGGTIGVVPLTTGVRVVNWRYRYASGGDGGGVGKPALEEDTLECEARLVFLEWGSGFEVVKVIGRVGRASG